MSCFALFYCLLPFNSGPSGLELELELFKTQITQKPMPRAEVGMRVLCAKRQMGLFQERDHKLSARSLCSHCSDSLLS